MNFIALCRRLQLTIDKLKERKAQDLGAEDLARDCCSETESEGNGSKSDGRSSASCSLDVATPRSNKPKGLAGSEPEELEDDIPLISILQSRKISGKTRTTNVEKQKISSKPPVASSNSTDRVICRKRVRVVLSDDEGEMENGSEGRVSKYTRESIATSDKCVFACLLFSIFFH